MPYSRPTSPALSRHGGYPRLLTLIRGVTCRRTCSGRTGELGNLDTDEWLSKCKYIL